MTTPFPSLRLSNLQRITRAAVEKRSLENPRTSLSDPAEWLWDAFGATKSKSGTSVNERSALQITAVIACVRVLAETVGSLPLIVYLRKKGGGKERASEHPNYTLLHDRPTPELPSMVWRETLMAHLALRGNAYVEKEFNGAGRPIALWPISPDRVKVERVGGVKTFKITTAGVERSFTSDTIMHIPGLGYDGLIGYNPISVNCDALGLAIAAQDHGAHHFNNAAEPSGVLEYPGHLSKEAVAKLKASWDAAHGGDKRGGTAVLQEGMKWQQLGVSNKESQYLELRKFSVSEIARIYRVPPHMIGDLERATFSNIEQQSIDFVVHTLRPWLVRWEQILNWELFGERSNYFCEFNVDGLLRGDSAARGDFYTKLFGVGALSPNDILASENRNPVDGGDQRYVPANMVAIDKPADPEAPKVLTDPPAPAEDEQEGKSDDAQRAVSAIMPMVRDVLERAEFREMQAAKRASKKGRVAFLAWVTDAEDEQIEYMARALMPIVAGAAALVAAGTSGDGIAQRMAAAEVATHVRGYRSLAEPNEDVVSAMFANTEKTRDDTAKNLAAQIVGALTLTDTRKAA